MKNKILIFLVSIAVVGSSFALLGGIINPPADSSEVSLSSEESISEEPVLTDQLSIITWQNMNVNFFNMAVANDYYFAFEESAFIDDTPNSLFSLASYSISVPDEEVVLLETTFYSGASIRLFSPTWQMSNGYYFENPGQYDFSMYQDLDITAELVLEPIYTPIYL